MTSPISLLCPEGIDPEYIQMTDETIHDLALNTICEEVFEKNTDQALALSYLSKLSKKEEVIKYRLDIFEDILTNKEMRDRMLSLLEKVDYIRQFSSLNRDTDASGIWQLLHRLGDLDDYITCVEEIEDCLSNAKIKSKGLNDIKNYVKQLHNYGNFAELKKDISVLKFDASEIKSLTLGVNLNTKLEPVEIGINSVNTRPFKSSKILHNFIDAYKYKNAEDGADWDGTFKFAAEKQDMLHQFESMPAISGLISNIGGANEVVKSLDRIASGMLRDTCRKLKNKLSEYASISINVIINNLLPEFLFYVKFAEYIENLQSKGYVYTKPSVLETEKRELISKGIFNHKLTAKTSPEEIVGNDLEFTSDKRCYILTGANRGGKTTITVAVGIAFAFAQAGLFVPAKSFSCSPVDHSFTDFAADENKTMVLGSLGEESKRFKDSFKNATKYSLLLLNESFSTTSFEEGYFIARGATKAIIKKGCRTIYNTHMHKLAFDIDEINQEADSESKAASLIVISEDGVRSFKIKVEKPVGQSYAMDIAKKYGVTFEQLISDN